ncbi:hypothetical protein ABK040_006349 [Willaertia magna]
MNQKNIYLKTNKIVREVKSNKKLTYSEYIRTDSLLALQDACCKGGLNHHDEHLFIVVHQLFELNFKQVLFELDSVKELMQDISEYNPHVFKVIVERLNRASFLFKNSLSTFDMLELMHPSNFLEFRDFIGPGSGFQSIQMREIELLMGLEDKERDQNIDIHSGIKEDIYYERYMKRKSEKSLKVILEEWLDKVIFPKVPSTFKDNFLKATADNIRFQQNKWNNVNNEKSIQKQVSATEQWLDGKEHCVSKSSVLVCPFQKQSSFIHNNISELKDIALESSDKLGARRKAILFINCYRHQNPELQDYADLIDSLLSLEESLILWRSRHATMVENFIGIRVGTGGTGLSYLQATQKYRIFKDLWQARSYYLAPSYLPSLLY